MLPSNRNEVWGEMCRPGVNPPVALMRVTLD
jgi:hypothetical protein